MQDTVFALWDVLSWRTIPLSSSFYFSEISFLLTMLLSTCRLVVSSFHSLGWRIYVCLCCSASPSYRLTCSYTCNTTLPWQIILSLFSNTAFILLGKCPLEQTHSSWLGEWKCYVYCFTAGVWWCHSVHKCYFSTTVLLASSPLKASYWKRLFVSLLSLHFLITIFLLLVLTIISWVQAHHMRDYTRVT